MQPRPGLTPHPCACGLRPTLRLGVQAGRQLGEPVSCFSPHAPSLLFQSFGFTLLARPHYHWQLSFLQAEQVLLEQLDEDGGCRRRCLQAVRQMTEDVWCPGTRPVITSHHLQVSAMPPGALVVESFPLRLRWAWLEPLRRELGGVYTGRTQEEALGSIFAIPQIVTHCGGG